MSLALNHAVTQMSETTLQNASVTATSQSTGIDVSEYEGIIAVSVRVANTTGTPTDDITLQHATVVGGSYATVKKVDGTDAVFAQFTAAGSQRILVDTNAINGFLRLSHVVGGGTPVLNLTAFVVGVKKVI